MDWMHAGQAALVAIIGTALADWLFFGVLFHTYYKVHPEVWRRPEGPDTRAIGLSALVSNLTPLAFVALCAVFGLAGRQVFTAALLVWLMVPLPLLVTSHLFIKQHPRILFAHSLGWLAKLLIAAAAVMWRMR